MAKPTLVPMAISPPKPEPPADLWDKLEAAEQRVEAAKREGLRPGPGWFTVEEYASRQKLSRVHAGERLRQLVDAGVLERQAGLSESRRHAYYYRVKE